MVRSDEYISIFLAVMIVSLVFTPIHTVNGQNELAYLETNMVRNDPNTNTFRVIQEQTAAMAFEWKQMTHKSFGYVYLVHDVYFWGDNTVKVYGGNIGLLEAVGKPCDVTKYRAEGYTNAFFPSNFRTYQMTYKRVPRIENVEIQLMPNLYPHVSWERETSACESTDSTIIFRGFSRQHLRMFIFPSDQAEYYANDFEPGEGMEEVFILFNEHENLFSLPTMAKSSPVPSRITEEIEVDSAAVNVAVKNEGTTKLMTPSPVPSRITEEIEVDSASNNLITSIFQYPRILYILIPILVVITFVISIVSFFLFKKLKSH